MATFNLNTNSNPACLGFVKVTAGTPLNITSNYTNLSGVQFSSISIQAHPSNAANVYVLNNSSPADKTKGTNIIAILAPGQSQPYSGPAQGGVNPSQFWVDVDTTNDIAFGIVYGV